MRWLGDRSPFTIYRSLFFFRYAPRALLYAIRPAPKDQVCDVELTYWTIRSCMISFAKELLCKS